MTGAKDAAAVAAVVVAAAAAAVEKPDGGEDDASGTRCQICCGAHGCWTSAHAVRMLVSAMTPMPGSAILIQPACAAIPKPGSVILTLGSMIRKFACAASALRRGGRSWHPACWELA